MSGDWCIVVKYEGRVIGLLNTLPVVGLHTAATSTTLLYENEDAAKEAAVGFTLGGFAQQVGVELVPARSADVPGLSAHPSAKLAHKLTSGGGDVVDVVKNLTRANKQLAEAGRVADEKHQRFMNKYKDPI